MTPFGPNGSDSSSRPRGLFRADLHAHSRLSGPGHLRRAGGRAGIGDPFEMHRAAKVRGMGLVTITDIDTIDGCLMLLDRYPGASDIIVSEEVTSRDPRTGKSYHVLAWDLTEAQHREIVALREDLRDLTGYLRQEGIVAGLSAGPWDSGAGIWSDPAAEAVLELFDRVEVKSGAHGRRHNEVAARLAQARGGTPLGLTGGSCAHGPLRVGRTWTAARAGTPREFMDELRAGRTWASGEDGGIWALSRDLTRSLARGYREKPGTILSLPLDLLRAPLRHGWRHARQAAHVRRAGRRLDMRDLVRFQQKARSYGPGAPDPGGRAADAS